MTVISNHTLKTEKNSLSLKAKLSFIHSMEVLVLFQILESFQVEYLENNWKNTRFLYSKIKLGLNFFRHSRGILLSVPLLVVHASLMRVLDAILVRVLDVTLMRV